MKKIMLFASVLLCAIVSQAQDTEPKTDFKRFYVNAGADFTDYHLTKNGYAGLEYRLKSESSIGLNLFYKEVPHKNGYSANFGKNYGFQLQFNHDWSKEIGLDTSKFDVYTGLNIGMTFQEAQARNMFGPGRSNFNNTSIDVGGQFGIRYFVFKNIGIHLEANTNKAVNGNRFELGPNARDIELRTGLTYKF